MVTETGQSRIEDELDKMLADSFPASDPPSFTPITGIGRRPLTDMSWSRLGSDGVRARP